MKSSDRQLRATFGPQWVRVYQAYSSTIADAAIEAGRLVPPFRFQRATWIKPSFLWMMHRSAWASRVQQERILAIDISREGFEWALAHGALSTFDPSVYASIEAWKRALSDAPVVIQWDPDRDILLKKTAWRTIQIGLRPDAVRPYTSDWTLRINDVTQLAHSVHSAVSCGEYARAAALVPVEEPYPLPVHLATRIGVDSSATRRAE